jgi:hypothetical protein
MYRLPRTDDIARVPASPPDARGAAAEERLDVVFVLSTLGIGGSERKIVRLAGRLAAGGIRTGIACLNGPYTLSNEVRLGVPLWKLERRGKLSLDTVRAVREIVEHRRPAALVAVNLYPCLYCRARGGARSRRPSPDHRPRQHLRLRYRSLAATVLPGSSDADLRPGVSS